MHSSDIIPSAFVTVPTPAPEVGLYKLKMQVGTRA
jgi:hypothetical protein